MTKFLAVLPASVHFRGCSFPNPTQTQCTTHSFGHHTYRAQQRSPGIIMRITLLHDCHDHLIPLYYHNTATFLCPDT
jgi:hypothetical protein